MGADLARATRLGRYLSYVLRHAPGSVGVELDQAGWVDVDVLLAALAEARKPVTLAELESAVEADKKGRFEIVDGRIRARQGHSVPVELDLPVVAPPDVLFHGTHASALAAIPAEGLTRQGRHHVHLSADARSAATVGARRGPAVVLAVDAARMCSAGHRFHVTGNGVWLTERVPPTYLTTLPAGASQDG